jgi:hypothetical protein
LPPKQRFHDQFLSIDQESWGAVDLSLSDLGSFLIRKTDAKIPERIWIDVNSGNSLFANTRHKKSQKVTRL